MNPPSSYTHFWRCCLVFDFLSLATTHWREGKPAKEEKKQLGELQLHNNLARVLLLQLHLDLPLRMVPVNTNHHPRTLGITTRQELPRLNKLNQRLLLQRLLMMKRYVSPSLSTRLVRKLISKSFESFTNSLWLSHRSQNWNSTSTVWKKRETSTSLN